MSDQTHEEMVALLRLAIEGVDPVIPKDKVPLAEGDADNQLYILGLMTATLTLMKTFFRAIEHQEGVSADVLGRSIVFGSITLMYLATHRDRLDELVARLRLNSARKLVHIYQSILESDGTSGGDRQMAKKALAKNGRLRKQLEDEANVSGWNTEPLDEKDMATAVQAQKLVTAMKHFDQAVHLNMTTVNSSVTYQPDQRNFTPTVRASPLKMALAVDHVLPAFFGGLLAAGDLMDMGDEVKSRIARLRSDSFSRWRPIFDKIVTASSDDRQALDQEEEEE